MWVYYYDDVIIRIVSRQQGIETEISKGILFPQETKKDTQARSVLLFACYQSIVASLRPATIPETEKEDYKRQIEAFGYFPGRCTSQALADYFAGAREPYQELVCSYKSRGREEDERPITAYQQQVYRQLISHSRPEKPDLSQLLSRWGLRHWFESAGSGRNQEYRIYGDIQFKWADDCS